MPPRTKRAVAPEVIEDARAAALDRFITAATRREPGSLFKFNGKALDVPAIPTGALSLDFALGVGGLPRGRVVEIYGPESAGKTSLALSVAAQAIKAGGMAAIIDAEHAITPSHLVGMGVDPDYMAITQPDNGEAAFTMLEEMLTQDLFDVIIIDSIAMLTPKAELEGEMTDLQVGAQARMMAKGLRKITALVGKSKAVVIFINQLRTKIGVMYGNPEDTPGGKAMKYNASVRLDVRSPESAKIKDPTDAKKFIGLGTTVTVKKNKVAPPQKKAEYRLIWGQGIDFAASVFSVAKEMGVLVADGGHQYTIMATGEVLTDEAGKPLRGAEKIQNLLSSNPLIADQIASLCYAALKESPADAVPTDGFDEEEDNELAEA